MTFEWTGVQSIRFENIPQMGIGLGFTHWFSAHWGVQILGQYHKSKLSGHSDPVHITYTYYAWMPDQPFPEVNVDYTLTSPREPSGSFRQLSLGLNAAYRFQVPPVELSLSGSLHGTAKNIKRGNEEKNLTVDCFYIAQQIGGSSDSVQYKVTGQPLL